jgi:hypothetical protein
MSMMDRRDLLKVGLALPAALALPARALAAMPGIDGPGIDALVLDRRMLGGAMPPEVAPALHLIDGDVTALWYETLDPRWRKPGFVLAGMTGEDSLFVLEQLAWDRGRRVTQRQIVHNAAVDGRNMVRWIIAPYHSSVQA